jgi:hypothetical protein
MASTGVEGTIEMPADFRERAVHVDRGFIVDGEVIRSRLAERLNEVLRFFHHEVNVEW